MSTFWNTHTLLVQDGETKTDKCIKLTTQQNTNVHVWVWVYERERMSEKQSGETGKAVFWVWRKCVYDVYM